MPVSKSLYIDVARVRSGSLSAYLLASAAVGAAVGLCLALPYWLAAIPFSLLYLAVMAATFFCGIGAGAFSVGLAALVGWFVFIAPRVPFEINSVAEASRLVGFVVVGTIQMLAVAAMRAAILRLRDSKNTLAAFFDANPDAILVVDSSHRIVNANQRAVELFGHPRGALMTEAIEALIPEGVHGGLVAHPAADIGDAQSRGIVKGVELSARHRDGTQFPVDVQIGQLQLGEEPSVIAIVRDIAARRAIAAELFETRRQQAILEERERGAEQLRDAIESIAGGFLITDAEDLIVLFNQKIAGYYPDCEATLRPGAPYRDFLRERIQRGYYPQAVGREDAWFSEAMARHHEDGNEVEIRLSDRRWLLLTERRMSNGGVAGVSLDITATKAAQQALGKSEERFRLIVESVPNAIVMINAGGDIEMVNDPAERIFGYSRSELLGRPVELLLPERHRFAHPELRAAFFADPQMRQMGVGRDLFARRKDGREFPVEIGLSPIETEDGAMVLAAIVDITERKINEQRLLDARHRAEEVLAALRKSEEQLSRAQRLAQMGSDVRNLRTDEAEWSDETYRIFGVSRETYVTSTENLLKMVHPDDRAIVLATREQIKQGKCPEPFEYRIIRPDGTTRQIYRENELILGEDGTPEYFAGTVHDVTERRQTEQQLRQAQKMEAIGNLTGGMAHDFNNLLGIIIGNLDLVRDRIGADQEAREIVGEALEAAWRGADLTRRLLAFARRQPLRPALLDLNELVGNTVRLLQRVLGEDIEITLSLAEDAWPVMADPAQLEASLANLATNARDAMPRGGRLIITTANRNLDEDYAATHVDVTAGEFALIEVSDTGIGMSAEIASQIFEPFFTTKEPGKGTGLGLSMVFGFLRQSGGHVNVYSEPGVGTTFRLYLPRATVEELPAEAPNARPAVRGAGETVLVVEDNPAMRRIVLRQLRELGYRVLECDRAAAGLELLQREQVDLLLTDIVMPGGLDGVELARLALERWPALKIVLTSGFPEARVNGNGEFLGSLRLLSKPYSKEELAAVVRTALNG